MSGEAGQALASVSLFLTVGSALALDEVMWHGSHAAEMASAVNDAILDPGSIFAARSPGARGFGLLLQTKHDRIAPAAYLPPPGLEGSAGRTGPRRYPAERPPETDLFAPPPPGPLVQTLPQFAMGGPPPPPGGVLPGAFSALPPRRRLPPSLQPSRRPATEIPRRRNAPAGG